MSEDVVRALLAGRTPRGVAELRAYVPDPSPVAVRLDANEAPPLLPTLDEGERAILNHALSGFDPARYPDVRATALREAVADKLGVGRDQLVFGVGSDEVIAMLLMALARSPDERATAIVVPAPTFVMYRMSARAHGVEVIEVPLDADCDLDDARIIEIIGERRPAVVFLATPNNPTSGVFSFERVQRVVTAARGVDPPTAVVVDEAYLPFRGPGPTGIDLLRAHGNVVVLRTLSKIGLASIRVGWAIAHPLLAAELDKVRLPYNLPVPSQAAAVAAFGPLGPAVDRHVAAIVAERGRLMRELRRIERAQFGRTDANFVWVRIEGASASEVVAGLRDNGVLVRGFASYPDRIRVTVGTPQEDDQFLAALDTMLK